MSALYQALILEHGKHPHHRGPLPAATHSATIDNPLCGDVVTLRLIVDGDRITDVASEGNGCTLSIAAASVLADRLIGMTVAEARELAKDFDALVTTEHAESARLGELAAFAPVREFRSRRVCATLPLRALDEALAKS